MRASTRPLAVFAIALATTGVSTAETLLHALGAQLRTLRALPVGTPGNATCPDGLEALLGVGRGKLLDALGAPDFIDPTGGGWTYYLAGPVPAGQLGGGYPEISFTFDASDQVSAASCHRAR